MIQAAHTLRQVRRANLDFLLNWHREQAQANQFNTPERLANLGPLDEAPEKRDWRHLYDGSVLDD